MGWSSPDLLVQVEGKDILSDETLFPQVVEDRGDPFEAKAGEAQAQDTIKDSMLRERARLIQAQTECLSHINKVPDLWEKTVSPMKVWGAGLGWAGGERRVTSGTTEENGLGYALGWPQVARTGMQVLGVWCWGS